MRGSRTASGSASRRGSLGAVSVVALSVTLSACGGSSSSHVTSTTLAASGAQPVTTLSLGSGGGAFCNAARKFQQAEADIEAKEMAAFSAAGTQSAAAAEAAAAPAILASVQLSKSALPELVSLAPADLKADAQTIATAATPILDEIISAKGDFSKLSPQQMQGFASAFTAPNVTAAQAALEHYGETTCGFPPPSTSVPTP